jgi:hypothetical protein
MAGSDDLTDEDLAALAEYEASVEGQKTGREETRAEKLTRLFYKTPAMTEHQKVIDAINDTAALDHDVTVSLKIPRRFITMLEFRERQDAADAGRAPASAEELLTLALVGELEEQLHWLVVEPARFEHYRNLWNRFCDEQGAPEEKIPPPGTAKDEGGEGAF